jgi:hypothetical protein
MLWEWMVEFKEDLESLHLRDLNEICERESVNRSQIDIKRKTCDIRTWKRHLLLDISSTNIDTLFPSLYQSVQTRSIQVF